MGRYDDLAAKLAASGIEHSFTPVSGPELEALRVAHPGIPEDYLGFLADVGWGSIGESGNYMVYGGLLEPSEVYDPETAQELDGLFLFGDDFSGNCGGFLPAEGWALVELGPSAKPERTDQTFETFIRERLGWVLDD